MRCLQVLTTGLALAAAVVAQAGSVPRRGIEHVRTTPQVAISTDALKGAELDLLDVVAALGLESDQAEQLTQDLREIMGVAAKAALDGEILVKEPEAVFQGREPSGFILARMEAFGTKSPGDLPQSDLLLELKAPERLAGLQLDEAQTNVLLTAAAQWMEAVLANPESVIPAPEVQP